MEFIPITSEDKKRMLEEIGVGSIEELFADIPREVREKYRPLGLKPKSELEIAGELKRLAQENSFISFLGGGIYDHFIPSVVHHITGRSEFYSAYTPYQAEASQGTLTWMFEWQTFICELTGMDIANSSMYEGGSALAEAMLMARAVTGRRRFLLAASVNPLYKEVIRTYAWAGGLELVEIPFKKNGRVDKDFIENNVDDIGGVLIQNPNFFGIIEDLSNIKEIIGGSLGVLEPPGSFGADVVVGEGQVLGNPQNFGGPLLGIFATLKKYLRRLPGRVSGRTVDAEGNIGYVMALQTREQHIRRERATSNICTNQALCALAATVYLASLGKGGFKKLALLNLKKAHYLAEGIRKLEGYSLKFSSPFFNEFVVEIKGKGRNPQRIIEKLKKDNILAGIDLSDMLENCLLVAVTEKRTKEEMDFFLEKLKEV
jgi:glycine dehydrogenase subunit 1